MTYCKKWNQIYILCNESVQEPDKRSRPWDWDHMAVYRVLKQNKVRLYLFYLFRLGAKCPHIFPNHTHLFLYLLLPKHHSIIISFDNYVEQFKRISNFLVIGKDCVQT